MLFSTLIPVYHVCRLLLSGILRCLEQPEPRSVTVAVGFPDNTNWLTGCSWLQLAISLQVASAFALSTIVMLAGTTSLPGPPWILEPTELEILWRTIQPSSSSMHVPPALSALIPGPSDAFLSLGLSRSEVPTYCHLLCPLPPLSPDLNTSTEESPLLAVPPLTG